MDISNGYLGTRRLAAAGTLGLFVSIALTGSPAFAQENSTESTSGIYANLAFIGQFQVSDTDPIYSTCNAELVCENSAAKGGGLELRLGYSVSRYFGFEAVGMFTGVLGANSMQASGPLAPNGTVVTESSRARRSDDIYVLGLRGFLGLGPRVSFGGDSLHVAFGASPGWVFGNYILGRIVHEGINMAPYTESAAAQGPGFLFDAGLLIGSVPGTRLWLGLLGLVDFADDVRSPGGQPSEGLVTENRAIVSVVQPPYRITRGTQFYLGPVLGLHFGH